LAFKEESPQCRPGSLGGAQDHVDFLGRDNPRLIAVDDAKAVREVQGLALRQVRLELGPKLLLAGVGEKVLNDGAARGRLFERDHALAGTPPALLTALPPAPSARPFPDVAPFVFHVEGLAAALRAIARARARLPAEDVADAGGRVVGALDHGFGDVADLD